MKTLFSIAFMFMIIGCGRVKYIPGIDPPTSNQSFSDEIQPEPPRNPQSIKPDADQDGLIDSIEEEIGSDPLSPDTDGDGLTDGQEYYDTGTSPVLADTDGGGAPDGQEIEDGTNPVDNPDDDIVPDGAVDTDGDGISDSDELNLGTDPNNSDTDGGGVSDGDELNAGTDPTNPADDVVICSQELVINGWKKGSGTQHRLTPFHGDITAAENYGYRSSSAHPTHGPAAENNTLFVYLYQSPTGLSLVTHVNANRSGDSHLERYDMDIEVSTQVPTPTLLLGDEIYQWNSDGNGRFELRATHWSNSDGGVIGHLGNNFEITIRILSATDSNRVVFASNQGGNISQSIVLSEDAITETPVLRIVGTGCPDKVHK